MPPFPERRANGFILILWFCHCATFALGRPFERALDRERTSKVELQRSGQTRRSGGQTLSSRIAAVGGQQFGWAETGFDLGMKTRVGRSSQGLEKQQHRGDCGLRGDLRGVAEVPSLTRWTRRACWGNGRWLSDPATTSLSDLTDRGARYQRPVEEHQSRHAKDPGTASDSSRCSNWRARLSVGLVRSVLK
jgi:hypothetical protein